MGDDHLPRYRDVTAVCAHPDDESFGLGAILAALHDATAQAAARQEQALGGLGLGGLGDLFGGS